MFEWLFPTWTNPAVLAAIVGGRAVVNGALTGLVYRETRPAVRPAAAAATLAVLSIALTVAVLRGTLGVTASYLEAVVQIALIVLGGYAALALAGRSGERSAVGSSASAVSARTAAVTLCLCALAGLLVAVPLYGEATVAP